MNKAGNPHLAPLKSKSNFVHFFANCLKKIVYRCPAITISREMYRVITVLRNKLEF